MQLLSLQKITGEEAAINPTTVRRIDRQDTKLPETLITLEGGDTIVVKAEFATVLQLVNAALATGAAVA